jgi:hypothetical protein
MFRKVCITQRPGCSYSDVLRIKEAFEALAVSVEGELKVKSMFEDSNTDNYAYIDK